MDASDSTIPAPSLDELQPLFPTYKLEGLVAQGGMGAIYKAHQRSLDRPVAIKILAREVGEDETFRETFAAEAKAMARLNHPNVIAVYDFGAADGMFFLVMEFVDGQSLREACDGIEVDPEKAAEVVTGICRGLAYAHDEGVLHRDLKPANILLDGSHQPKIGNFGLAHGVGERGEREERAGFRSGYAAPELAVHGRIDERSEIYAVGAVLYCLLTGREPGEAPLPAASSLCGCPSIYDAILARATDPDPAARYASADEMADDLENAAKSNPLRALSRLGVGTAPAPVRPPGPVPAKRKSAAALVVAAAAVLALVAGGAYLATRSGGARPGPETAAELKPVVEARAAPRVGTAPKAVPKPAPQDSAPKESVQAGLARLKDKLAVGGREEFPEGTAAHDGSHFLVVDAAMTWSAAERFAEHHGAHLAVLPAREDRDWLRKHCYFKRPLWLGAGLAGREEWQWLDAAPWNASDTLSGSFETRRYLALSATGGLFPARHSQEYGLVLQWRGDGTNPGTLEAQLKRTAKILKEGGTVLYPVGTRTREDSHYFHLETAMSWKEARQLAESAGGYLAIPSTAEEHAWMCSTLSVPLARGQAFWLGGFRLKLETAGNGSRARPGTTPAGRRAIPAATKPSTGWPCVEPRARRPPAG